jgi:hypothetical protein
MSPRIKSILALGGTLLLGMVLGGLLTGAVIKKRTNAFALMMINEQRYVERLETLIEPSAAQKDTLRTILKKYGKVVTTRSREFRAAQLQNLDSLKSELQPILSAEQYERFNKATERLDRRKKGAVGLNAD